MSDSNDNASSSSSGGVASAASTASRQRTPLFSHSVVDVLAGWVSGAVSILACQPVDTILTRWQALSMGTIASVGGATHARGAAPSRLSSTLTPTWRSQTVHLIQTAGYSSLWRGSLPMMVVVPVQNGLLMGGYGWGSRYWNDRHDTTNSTHDTHDTNNTLRTRQCTAIFVGGCTGGVLQSFLMAPVEWLKVSRQVSNQSWSTVRRHARSAARQWGVTATVWRDGIPHGVWFVVYDVCKTTLHPDTDDTDADTDTAVIPVSVSLVSGAVAATVAWVVGYPADLIKTRIQASTNAHTLTVLQTARVLLDEAQGNVWHAWYRGLGLKLVRSIPASMIGFTVYEQVSSVLSQY